MLFRDLRDEVDFERCFLRLEDQASVAEDILNDAMLALVDVLQRPDVDRLMVVDGEEVLFDAVDFAIGDDDDVEKMDVETHEKAELHQREQRAES